MKLIAIDLDGTLLSEENRVTPENVEALQKAQNQGNIIMICSGRSPEDIQHVLRKHGISCPLAGSNGTIVQVNGKLLESISMDKENVMKIVKKLNEDKISYQVYTNRGIFTPSDWLERAELTMKKDNIQADDFINDIFRGIAEQICPSGIIKQFDKSSEWFDIPDLSIQKLFLLTLNGGTKSNVIAYLDGISGIAITFSNLVNVEVMDQKGNKGTALKRMAEYYGIPMDDTVAIGDNFNDIPMLQSAGLSIAMENAEPLVKDMCDVMTYSNSKNGVAYAIDKYILN